MKKGKGGTDGVRSLIGSRWKMGLNHRWKVDSSSTETLHSMVQIELSLAGRRRKQRTSFS